MKQKYYILILFLVFSASVAWAQAPSNDNCSNALALNMPQTGYLCEIGTNLNATSEGLINSCDLAPAGMEVWYKYVTNGDSNTLTINPIGVVPITDLSVTVYTGDCESLVEEGCNSNTGANTVQVSTTIPEGTTVWVSVESNGTDGDFQLCIQSDDGVVPSDECADAPLICDLNPFTVTDMSSYTAEPFNITCGLDFTVIKQSCWVKFSPTTSGFLEFVITPLTGTEFDWALYDITSSGCPTAAGNEITCNIHYSTTAAFPGCNLPGAKTGMLIDTAGEVCNKAYSNPAQFILAGRTYALLIDNYDANNDGFTFEWGSSMTARFAAQAGISANPTESCTSPVNVTVSNNAIGTASQSSYDFGDGNSGIGAIPASHTYTGNGDYLITQRIESSNGCVQVASDRVNVNIGPVLSISTTDTNLCVNDTIQLNGVVALGSPTNTTQFNNSTITGIPDNSSTGANPSISVSGVTPTTLKTGMVEEVCFTISHQNPQDVTIVELISPAGDSYLYNVLPLDGVAGTPVEYCFPTSALAGITGNVNGTWTLHVEDNSAAQTGLIFRWHMKIGDENLVSFGWTPNDATISNVNIVNPKVYPASNAIYTLTATDLNGCVSSKAVNVNIMARPSGTLSGGGAICFGDSVQFQIALSGTPPFNFSYTNSLNVPTIISGYTGTNYTFWSDSTDTFTMLSTSDLSCSGTASGSGSATITEEIKLVSMDTVCTLAADFYTIVIRVTGGDTATLGVAGNSGTLVKGDTSVFTSNPIASNTAYVFLFSDIVNCNTLNLLGLYKCECGAGATVTRVDSTICSGDSVAISVALVGVGPWMIDYSDGSGTTSDGTSTSPYIFQAKNTGVYTIPSISDIHCTDIGTDSAFVTVKSLPTATIINTGSSDTICPSEAAEICIYLDGEGPYDFTYHEDTTNTSTVITNHGSDTLCFSANTNSNFHLTALNDNYCVGSVGSGSGVANVFVIDAVTTGAVSINNNLAATKYVVSFPVSNGDPTTYSVIDGAGISTGSISSGPPYTFTSDSILCGATYFFEVSDGVGCIPDTIQGNHNCICAAGATHSSGTVDTICNKDSSAISFNLTGAAPWTLTYNDGSGNTSVQTNTSPYTYWAKADAVYNFSTVSDANCQNSFTASIDLTVHPLPTASLSGDATLCADGSEATITISLTGNGPWDFAVQTGADSLLYDTTSATVSFNSDSSAIYSVMRLSDANCVATNLGTPQSVTMIEPDTAEINYPMADYCEGGAIILPTVSTSTNLGGIYSVSPTSININATTGALDISSGVSNTTYTITYNSPPGLCTAMDQDSVKIIPYDASDFTYDDTVFCPLGTTTPTLGLGSATGGTFQSSPGTLTIDPATGTVILSSGIVDSCYLITYTTPIGGCQTTDTFDVCFQLNDNATFSYSDSVFCDSGMINVSFHPAATMGGVFTSSPTGLFLNENTGNIDLDSTQGNTTYSIVYTTPASVCQSNHSTTLTIKNTPLSYDTVGHLCEYTAGAARSFASESILDFEDFVTGGNSNLNVTWYEEDTAGVLFAVFKHQRSIWDQETFYAVVDNDGYCATQSKIRFDVHSVANAGPNTSNFVAIGTGMVDLNVYLKTPYTNGTWYYEGGDTVFDDEVDSYFAEGEFMFVQEPEFPCLNDTSLHDLTILSRELIIPNAFTPNDDLKNDSFLIRGLNEYYPNNTVQIFNRWGALVYETTSSYLPWDGKRNGKSVAQGTYFYVIELNDASESDKIKGTVTIVK